MDYINNFKRQSDRRFRKLLAFTAVMVAVEIAIAGSFYVI